MALQSLLTSSSTQIDLGTSDDLYLGFGGELFTTSHSITAASGSHELHILGSVTAFNGDAIQLFDGIFTEILIGESGSVTTFGLAGVTVSVSNAVSFINAGQLSGTGAYLVDLAASDAGADIYFNNSGTVTGNSASTSYGAVYMQPQDGVALLINSGSITAQGYGVRMFSTNSGYGNDLINTGLIQGSREAVTATNSALRLRNDGTILGDVVASGTFDDLIVNSGTMIGDIEMGGGADQFRGFGGTVTGGVYGGAGDDTFWVDQAGAEVDGGTGVDTVYARGDTVALGGVEVITLLGSGDIGATGDAGNNDIYGNVGDNELIGGEGNDSLNGRAGDDVLEGMAGADVLRGSDGDDFMDGGTSADTLNGNEGNDTLIGGYQDDLIVGGTGDDRIIGGRGSDLMKGGAGNDTFVFETVDDAAFGTTNDRILDFVSGQDVIDLTDIGDAAFTFRGTAAFTGGGGMELRYIVTGTGHALVDLDADGDGSADARITVLNNTTLSADDFIL